MYGIQYTVCQVVMILNVTCSLPFLAYTFPLSGGVVHKMQEIYKQHIDTINV